MRNPRRSNSPASSTAGSDSRLTQCPPVSCFAPSPLFDPLRSASFSALPCTHKLCRAMALQDDSACAARDCFYHYHYGDDTDTLGFMGSETFTFGSTKKVSIPSIGFGCGLYNAGDIQNSSGVIGFGRGPISLISQLGVGTFSYCFTDFLDDDPKTSPLFFGTLARLTGPHIRTTRLIRLAQSMQPYSSYYHVSLKAITVGGSLLSIPPEVFQVNKDGSEHLSNAGHEGDKLVSPLKRRPGQPSNISSGITEARHQKYVYADPPMDWGGIRTSVLSQANRRIHDLHRKSLERVSGNYAPLYP
ncbi:aspartic proteinase nepenthesin-2-like [Asparagus officinalis]|uniref:aspartic proteinase nepenthesin-2-like n=1 Tax=Asparagus officinalis TaxID=4686 RepID=UPI00098E36A6|nr:aspartic proteinase nepenthesin-2-like [Asparagus officinalis]